ncbi:GTPase Era [Agrococcus sediminis]|uniref:GTPase Era n=1 Tax=Agrococcus sediminis TaxID=2599924 RepID=A0A5M8QCX0_9MICO|nr:MULTISPECIES: GTPase Era [Agrococcus]KAA6433867.1 GTPase Era [Agrococcus sediminis]MDR7234484.1 GTP-binding protein Era [Agrococcus sp. BE272]
MTEQQQGPHRSGFVTFVGRPNAGKSTLMNALVGEKIAITSSKPQTTRHAIRGVVHRDDAQLVIVDTPGMHKPRTLLGKRLNAVVQTTLGDVDVICLCVPADEPLGPGDRYIDQQLEGFPRARKVAVVTKTDAASRERVAAQLLAVTELREWDAVVPLSSVAGTQLDVLVDALVGLLPEGPPLYEAETTTEEPLDVRIAELVREAALEGVRDELPHSIMVTIDDIVRREDRDLTDVYANLWVERDSQKGIIIGHKGSRLRQVGADARAEIERIVGTQVHLDLRVKVAKEWQGDPKQLGRFGF